MIDILSFCISDVALLLATYAVFRKPRMIETKTHNTVHEISVVHIKDAPSGITMCQKCQRAVARYVRQTNGEIICKNCE